MAMQADVRKPAAAENMIKHIQTAWGGIDVLVHNTLTPYVVKSFQHMAGEKLGSKLDDAMRAAFVVTNAVLPTMIEQGRERIIYRCSWRTALTNRAFISPLAPGKLPALLSFPCPVYKTKIGDG
jgi:NADP-dependent 3-hydroxy acid dehydrogenase YdfG